MPVQTRAMCIARAANSSVTDMLTDVGLVNDESDDNDSDTAQDTEDISSAVQDHLARMTIPVASAIGPLRTPRDHNARQSSYVLTSSTSSTALTSSNSSTSLALIPYVSNPFPPLMTQSFTNKKQRRALQRRNDYRKGRLGNTLFEYVDISASGPVKSDSSPYAGTGAEGNSPRGQAIIIPMNQG